MEPLLIVALVIVLFAVAVLMKAVRIVPQARARNVERLGRYQRTLTPGLNLVVPFVDRVYPAIDLREQVVTFAPQPVITEDNLVVEIDTVLYFQVTDPRSAAYEIASYLQAVEQLTVTTLRNVVGSMDLEQTLTSRDEINSRLRGVLDEATGKWGLRVNRVEIKAVDPPKSIKDAMEKQMRAERDKRASILTAEGARASQILTAEGDKQGAILRAEGERAAAILRAEGEARSIDQVFAAVHRNDLDPKVLAYQYLQTLPELARGEGNTFWVIPSEVTSALSGIAQAFGPGTPRRGRPEPEPARGRRRRDRRGGAPPGRAQREREGRHERLRRGSGAASWITRRRGRAAATDRRADAAPSTLRSRTSSTCSSTPRTGPRRPPTPSRGGSSPGAGATAPSTPCSPHWPRRTGSGRATPPRSCWSPPRRPTPRAPRGPGPTYDAGQAAAHLTAQASALGLSVRQMGGFTAADLPALPERITPLVVVAVGVALPADRIPEGHPATRLPARGRRPLDELLLDVA